MPVSSRLSCWIHSSKSAGTRGTRAIAGFESPIAKDGRQSAGLANSCSEPKIPGKFWLEVELHRLCVSGCLDLSASQHGISKALVWFAGPNTRSSMVVAASLFGGERFGGWVFIEVLD